MIVVRVKGSSGFEPFSSMGTDSADTNQLPNGEICMDNSHLLPNNPARQCTVTTLYQLRRPSVPILAALCTNFGGPMYQLRRLI